MLNVGVDDNGIVSESVRRVRQTEWRSTEYNGEGLPDHLNEQILLPNEWHCSQIGLEGVICQVMMFVLR
jgi:hypothetical protein